MRVIALKEEHVYGCGEKASYFNLRGRNFFLHSLRKRLHWRAYDQTTTEKKQRLYDL